jgi:hypothetical protein
MYYKILSKGQIVDVCGGLSFVRYQKRNDLFLSCDGPEGATGLISSDGSTIYLLDGAEQDRDLEYATYTEITEDDYNDLRQQLVENGVLQDAVTETQDANAEDAGGSTEHEPVAKSRELLLIEKQQEQIDFLTECILEMSEAVYG